MSSIFKYRRHDAQYQLKDLYIHFWKLHFQGGGAGLLEAGGVDCSEGSESIEWFKEGQAFSRSYDLAPSTPLPLKSVRVATGDTQEDWERETTCWREGDGRGAELYARKKASFSINRSKLSVKDHVSVWVYGHKNTI